MTFVRCVAQSLSDIGTIAINKRFFAILLFLLPLTNPAYAATTSLVEYQNNQLTVLMKDVPIKTALEQLAHKLNIRVLFDKALTGTVSAKFTHLSAEEGLRRILKHQSHALFFKQVGKDQFVVEQVRIFREGMQAQAEYEVIEAEGSSVAAHSSATRSANSLATRSGAVAQPRSTSANETAKNTRVTSPSQVIKALNESQRTIAMLNHKAQVESDILQGKIAEQRRLAAMGEGDVKERLDEAKFLTGQKAKSAQNNRDMLLNEQKNMLVLQKELVTLKNPAEERQALLTRLDQQQRTQSGKTRSSGQQAQMQQRRNKYTDRF